MAPVPGRGSTSPMWLALGGTLTLAVTIAAAVTYLGLHYLHFREFRPEPELSAATLYDLLKVAFAVAAGIGAVVALVTAYRRQRITEFAEQREGTRLFNERFTAAAGQLGDESPAVRLAGVYAMASADDWAERRQTCVDVLCAYLRMPYEPEPASDPPEAGWSAYRAAREVRHTVIRVITAHLQPDSSRAPTLKDWRGLNLDFTAAVLDGGDFSGAEFTSTVSFASAQFTGGIIDFSGAKFSGTTNFMGSKFAGSNVSFRKAEFSGNEVNFVYAVVTGGTIDFDNACFSGCHVDFGAAHFDAGIVYFNGAEFTGVNVSFASAAFSGSDVHFGAIINSGKVSFLHAQFSEGTVYLGRARLTRGIIDFDSADFTGSIVDFGDAQFTGATVDFRNAQLTGGVVDFGRAQFTGAAVDFSSAQFAGSTVDFHSSSWSVPPSFPAWDDPPAGVTMPEMNS